METKKVTLAKSAGFCFGVRRAVEQTENALAEKKHLCSLGELIHNPYEVERLRKLGLDVAENVGAVTSKDVIIRTHGVGKKTVEELEKNGHGIIDLTCPFVKKIHRIAEKSSSEGKKTVIIGTAGHPEVDGILGWCENGVVISTAEEVNRQISPEDSICVVAQTTISRKMFDTVKEAVLEINPQAEIFDTICSATSERQSEALELAAKSDAFIVIGGRHSSNTKKLCEIAKTVCNNTFLIENAGEIDLQAVENCTHIGITAGASTPDQIIKEVFYTMEKSNIQENLNFAELLEESMKTLNTGDTVTGTVVDVRPTEVVLELDGCKYNGIIDLANLTEDPTAKPSDLVSCGDQVEAFVIQVDDNNGQVRLSKKKLETEKNFIKIREAFEAGTILEGKVVEVLEKGVIAMCEGVRVFIPASQASERFLEDLQQLKGQVLPMKIIDVVDGRRRRIVASVKAVLKEESAKKREAFWADVEEGKVYTGVVKSITPFGVFVDIGGVDGLIHISEISWRRINHPSEVLSEGQVVEVNIKEIDEEKQKISLGYKRIEDNPWEIFKSKYSEGDVVTCKVVRTAAFGAFAEIIDGVDGLIHISQISKEHINAVTDVLTPGMEVEAKIIEIKPEDGKVSLSMKALLPDDEPEAEAAEVSAEDAEEAAAAAAAVAAAAEGDTATTAFEAAVEAAEEADAE